MFKAVSLLVLSFVLSSSLSFMFVRAADPVFQLGMPSFGGSGCPDGSTVTAVVSTDGQIVSMLFTQFAAATTSTMLRDRKACNLILPVSVLPGISIGVFQVDYRGYGYVPDAPHALAKFQANYFFAGSNSGPAYVKTWNSSFEDDILITNRLAAGAVVWSRCELTTTNFRINAAVTAVKGAFEDEDVQIAIDSTDITVESNGMHFYITYQTCP